MIAVVRHFIDTIFWVTFRLRADHRPLQFATNAKDPKKPSYTLTDLARLPGSACVYPGNYSESEIVPENVNSACHHMLKLVANLRILIWITTFA